MTKPRKQPSSPAGIGEQPSAYLRQHATYQRAEWQQGVDRQTFNVTESRLRELEFLGVITARQREAGELFEADYWLTIPRTTPRDSLDVSIRGEDHETEAAAERVRQADARIRKVRREAGPFYVSLRHVCVFRERLKMAAVVLPVLLDKTAEIYGLERK